RGLRIDAVTGGYLAGAEPAGERRANARPIETDPGTVDLGLRHVELASHPFELGLRGDLLLAELAKPPMGIGGEPRTRLGGGELLGAPSAPPFEQPATRSATRTAKSAWAILDGCSAATPLRNRARRWARRVRQWALDAARRPA